MIRIDPTNSSLGRGNFQGSRGEEFAPNATRKKMPGSNERKLAGGSGKEKCNEKLRREDVALRKESSAPRDLLHKGL